MTTIQQVGSGLAIPNGDAWTHAIARARATGGPVTNLDVAVAAALYVNDYYAIPQYCNFVTLNGLGLDAKRAHLKNELASGMPHATGVPFQGAVGDKGLIVILGDNTSIRSFEIEGAKTSSGSNNGAAIRLLLGTNVSVDDCYLHHNQNGMLLTTLDDPTTPADDRGIITISNTHFYHNGFGGQAHHLYMDDGLLLNILNTLFEEAVGQGNCIKTRTDKTFLYNTTVLQTTGLDSYELDAMGGEIKARGFSVTKRSAASSQPNKCVHIYYEPKSKPMVLDFDGATFDLRDPIAGKPFVLDTRIKHEGEGGTIIGADGQTHPKGENYYVPGEYGPKPQGKLDNITFYVNKDLKHSFGYDGKDGRTPIFHVQDPLVPPDMLSDIEIGPNVKWVEV